MEEWRDIPGWEGLYQASNLGRVRSLDRVVNHNYGGTAIKKGRILTPRHHRGQVTFIVDGVRTYPFVSRLVYSAFHGPIPQGMQVNHIDENPENNNLDNLNLMTPKENTNWGTGIERRAKSTSIALTGKQLFENNPNSKTVMEYNKDGVPVCFWFSIKAAAEYHGKHYTTIMLCLKNKTHLRDGSYFEYVKKEAV